MKKHIIKVFIFFSLLSFVYVLRAQETNNHSFNELNSIENVDKAKSILWSGIVVNFLWFFSGICIGGFLIYRYSKRIIYSILSEEKSTYLDLLQKHKSQFFFKYLGIVAILKTSKDEKKMEIDKLNLENQTSRNRIASLELKTISNLNTHYSSSTPKESVDENVEPKVMEWVIDQDVKNKTQERGLFFTIPDSDGSFNIRNGKITKDNDCFYSIETGEDANIGKLHYLSGDYDLRALDNIDYYLNPVCHIENITDRSSAQRIAIVNPGVVNKNGDVWKIDINNKVKIRFI